MRINCDKCGEKVCEGEVKKSDNDRKPRDIFVLQGQILGEIHKNHSNNPHDWSGLCSKCQSEEQRINKRKGIR